jgi:hypothetical protein
MSERAFNTVICVTGGDGYEEGKIYAQIGGNNGIHILRETKDSDVYDRIFSCGGVGKGFYNDFCGTGAPSFDDYCESNTYPAEDAPEVLKKQIEEQKAYIEHLERDKARMMGEIKALRFAVRCNGISGNEVTE